MSGWLWIAVAFAGWTALSIAIGLIVGRIARLGNQMDAHLDASQSAGSGNTPQSGSARLLDDEWRWPPLIPYQRERPGAAAA